jgi:hypothetical protein
LIISFNLRLNNRRSQSSRLPDSAGGFWTCGCSLVKSARNTDGTGNIKSCKETGNLAPRNFHLTERSHTGSVLVFRERSHSAALPPWCLFTAFFWRIVETYGDI